MVSQEQKQLNHRNHLQFADWALEHIGKEKSYFQINLFFDYMASLIKSPFFV